MADAKIRSKFSTKDLTPAEKFVYRVLLSMSSSSYAGIIEYISVVPGTGFFWNKNAELDDRFGMPSIKEASAKYFDDGSVKIREDALKRREFKDSEARNYLKDVYLREDARIVLREREKQFKFDNLLLMVLAGGDYDTAFDRQRVLGLNGTEWMFNTPATAHQSFKSLSLEALRMAEKALQAKSAFERAAAREVATGENADRVRALIAAGMETASPGYLERRRETAGVILKALREPLSEMDA